jgi:hypothetical protein
MFINLVIYHLIWTEPSKTQHTNTTKKELWKLCKLGISNKIYLLIFGLLLELQKSSLFELIVRYFFTRQELGGLDTVVLSIPIQPRKSSENSASLLSRTKFIFITFKFVHEVAKVQHGPKNVNSYQFCGFLLKAVKGRTLVTWCMLSQFSIIQWCVSLINAALAV